MVEAIHALPVGAHLGSYQITRLIGEGGFGIIYEAINLVTERRVAIKEFFPNGLATRDMQSQLAYSHANESLVGWALEKFEKTTRDLCRLDHPNIIRVHDYMRGNRTGYMLMELLHGQTLEAWLQARGGQPATPAELRPLVEPILSALSYVHGQGLIHRDIATDNIFVCHDGRPVLIDFGALSRDVSKATRKVGTVGVMKAHYTAPDQAHRNAIPDPTADVYSMGAVLYRALAGQPPEDGPARAGEIGLGGVDPYLPLRDRRPDSVPPEMAEAIDAALRLRKAERPQTIAELRSRLGWGETGPASHPVAVSQPTPISRPPAPEALSTARSGPAVSRPGLGEASPAVTGQPNPPPEPLAPPKDPPKRPRAGLIAAAALVMLLGGVGLTTVLLGDRMKDLWPRKERGAEAGPRSPAGSDALTSRFNELVRARAEPAAFLALATEALQGGHGLIGFRALEEADPHANGEAAFQLARFYDPRVEDQVYRAVARPNAARAAYYYSLWSQRSERHTQELRGLCTQHASAISRDEPSRALCRL